MIIEWVIFTAYNVCVSSREFMKILYFAIYIYVSCASREPAIAETHGIGELASRDVASAEYL